MANWSFFQFHIKINSQAIELIFFRSSRAISMSKHTLSCVAAALSPARSLRDQEPWLTAERLQKLNAVLAFVFVAEDVDCASIRGNASAEALLRAPRDANLGLSALDARGKRCFEAFDADGVLLTADRWPLQRAARGEALDDAWFELRFEDGARVFLQGAASPLHDETGAIHGAIGVFTDIDSWKERERALRREMEACKARPEALQTCGEPFVDLARFAPAILWVADGDGAAIAQNDQWLSYTGQSREQALGAGWMASVHPDDVESVGKRWLESVGAGVDFDIELRIRRASDGAWRWHLAKATPLRNSLGHPFRWYGTCVDIEDRKQAETAKRESDQLFRTVFENAASGIAISQAAPDGVFLRTNDRLCEMLGYGPGELAGRSFTELTHPDDRQMNTEHLQAILAGEIATCAIEKRYLKRDGGSVWAKVNLALMRGEDGKPGIFIGSMVDIGDLKHAEQALRGSEERFRVLVETSSEVVFEADPAGEWIGDLPTWRAFSGQTPEDWSHEGWAEAVHPEDRDRAISGWRGAIEAGITYHDEYRLRRADGVYRWASLTAAPLHGADRRIVRWVGMFSDITDDKKAQEALRQSEKRMRLALKAAHAGIWCWNIRTGKLIWTPETFALYERDPKLGALRIDDWRAWLHPDDLESTDRIIRDDLNERRPEHTSQFRVILPSGGIRWIESLASVDYAPDGTPLRMFGIDLDVTEEKQAEEVLRLSEENLRLALKGAHAGTWQWNFATGELIWSEETCAQFGRDPQLGALRYDDWRNYVHPEDVEPVERTIRGVIEKYNAEDSVKYRVILPSGAVRWIETLGSLEFAADGTPLGMHGISRDITERKLADETLRQSEERLRFALKGARAGVWDWKIATGEMDWSPEMLALYGRDPQLPALRYDVWRTWLHPDDLESTECAIRDALNERMPEQSAQFRVILPSGRIRWIMSLASPEFAPDGTPLRMSGINLDITEAKQAEEALRRSEETLRFALKGAQAGAWLLDLATGEASWSPEMYALFQRDPQRAAPRYDEWLSALHPDDRECVELAIRDAYEKRMPENRLRFRMVLASGAIRWIEALTSFEFAADGTPLRIGGINLDATERQQAEEALRRSEERLRFALKGARAGVWERDIASRELVWSLEMFELFERDPQLGAPPYDGWRNYVHPDDLEATERAIAEVLEKRLPEHSWQYRAILPSGATHWIETLAALECAADGTPHRLFGINRDITERKQAELRLAESEARFRAAQEASLDGFMILQPVEDESGGIADFKVVYVNPIAAKFCRSVPAEMEGRLSGDLLPGTKAPGGFIDRTRRIVESGRAEEFLIEYDADGIAACFRNLVVPFGGHVAVTIRDDTELIRDAKALGLAKSEAESANRAKSKFLAAASHDLRQPVQSLIMLMAVIRRQVADRPKVAQAAQMAADSVKSLHEMLTGFLDISRLDAGVVQPEIASVDVSAMVSRLAREYLPRAAAAGLALRCRPRDFHARTDAALLERILRNLLENALRYTAKGGVFIGLRQRGDRVRLDVIDTGIGIALDKQAEIFEEFRQLGNPARDANLGQGLGLAIVARLAKLLKAEVQVYSRPGRGARFSLLLPETQAAAPVALVSRPAVDHPGGRILVIEDNAAVRRAYQAMLEFSGYEILGAETGEEALALAAREGWRFEAILADHRLGAGLTGTAAAKEISRRAGRAIPTLIVTGDTAREPLTEISASGFAMLHKPVDTDKLCEILASLLPAAGHGHGARRPGAHPPRS
jgi:PAS domain S-box-containing protein